MQLGLLDTAPSESFDRITRLAGQLFDLPIAAVSLTDRDRQWFKSRIGIEHWSIPRFRAPCAEVAETTNVLVIADLLDSQGYNDSLLAQQGIRYYAGAPLVTRDGHGLGSLCVLGTEPRETTNAEISALRDMAKMVMAQIELQHAFGRIDPISNLPNRVQLFEDLEDLGRDQPGERRLLVVVEAARNDQVNSGVAILGTAFVEEMIRETARRFRETLPNDRRAYYVAPLQFAYLAERGIDQDAYVDRLARELARVNASWNGRFIVTAAIGIKPFIAGEKAPEDVLRAAHSAVHDARHQRRMISVYCSSAHDLHRRRFELLNEFRSALENSEQLRLVFQPRIDVATHACIGAECLLRWNNPTFGNVSPSEFMPSIERTDLARLMTNRVLDTALAQQAEWKRSGIELQLSINISAVNLQEPDFAERVQLYLLKHAIRPETFEIEITESAIMENELRAFDQLNALREAGVNLAIDDFGTGYSSLAYLQRLPAQIVKIDRSFMGDLTPGSRGWALVKSIIDLSHQLDYRVVSEGVETADVAESLKSLKCDEIQGYYYSRPLESDAFATWFRDYKRDLPSSRAA